MWVNGIVQRVRRWGGQNCRKWMDGRILPMLTMGGEKGWSAERNGMAVHFSNATHWVFSINFQNTIFARMNQLPSVHWLFSRILFHQWLCQKKINLKANDVDEGIEIRNEVVNLYRSGISPISIERVLPFPFLCFYLLNSIPIAHVLKPLNPSLPSQICLNI